MSKQAMQVRDADDSLSKGEIFDVLQNERRRYTLQYLRENSGPVALGDLASHVAAMEYDCDSTDVSSAQRKRVYTTLQQTHLPRLDEAGIVEYDSDDNLISTTPQTQELTVYLEIVSAGEFPWREYYLSLSAVSLAVVTVLWVGVYPFTLISPLVWATLITIVFALSAVYHTYAGREMTLSEYTSTQRENR
jgi:DNA-binding transcriptional ArsR family regulator